MAKMCASIFDAVGNTAAPVLEILAAVVIVSAQKGTAHAARDAVVPGGIRQADEGGARAGNG